MLDRQPVSPTPFLPQALGALALCASLLMTGCGGGGSSSAPAAAPSGEESGREVSDEEVPDTETPEPPPEAEPAQGDFRGQQLGRHG